MEMFRGNWNINPIDCLWGEGGDVVTETNSNEHPRLNSFELRSINKVNNYAQLSTDNFKCSNLINSFRINNVCKPLLKANTIILEKRNNSLTSYKLGNIRNTLKNNLVTIDNNYSTPASVTPRFVQNDGDLPPNKRKSQPSTTLRQPSFLPNFDFNKYSSHILSCNLTTNTFPNPITSNPSINVITVPPKFWRKKPVNSYKPIIYDDVDDYLCVFKSFGRSMKHSSHFIPKPRSDLILWDNSVDEPEILRDFLIDDDVDVDIRNKIINIIKDN